jgi:hypothetical protein
MNVVAARALPSWSLALSSDPLAACWTVHILAVKNERRHPFIIALTPLPSDPQP